MTFFKSMTRATKAKDAATSGILGEVNSFKTGKGSKLSFTYLKADLSQYRSYVEDQMKHKRDIAQVSQEQSFQDKIDLSKSLGQNGIDEATLLIYIISHPSKK